MNKSELSEIKKLFNEKNCAVSRIATCYVGGEKNKISELNEIFGILPEAEASRYLQLFKKGLSGTLGKNLISLSFPLESEFKDGAQKFLLDLRDSHLQDEELLEKFYDKIIESYPCTQNYLILLADANYDVPGRSSDNLEMDDASDEVYHFLFCCLCPVVLSKPGLTYAPKQNLFMDRICDWIVDAPVHSFLFPAFTDRSTDLHSCLYYTKDTENAYEDFVYDLLGCTMPITAGVQKEAFQTMLQETLGDNGELTVVKNIHDTLYDMIEEHKEDPEPLSLDKREVTNMLAKSGLKEPQLSSFEQHYDETVGSGTKLVASNLTASRNFEVKMPDVVIKVNPERSDLVETTSIDGRVYLLIEVSSDIEVNGIRLLPEAEPTESAE
ncbi:MAG: DUF4317 domain-containing protein [Lachnospiraceae bacterium]|nr:DUF4317 domain-containing protein [Lachnospiraceae bacterium]